MFYPKISFKKSFKMGVRQQNSHRKIGTEVKGVKKSDSFIGDKYVLKQQLILFQKCLEVDSCFFLSIAQIGIHVSKYSTGSNLYWSIMKKLNKIAEKIKILGAEKIT